MSRRPRFLVPETVQTSAVDCGPAALKSLLEGFGFPASYGRLREACQTGLDGTSIDTIEVVARQTGLNAEQVMLPPDYLAIDPTALPAVVVVRLPTGYAHFVLVWRKVGSFFQIMDPAAGRQWVRCRDLIATVYVHSQIVNAAAWREWAGSADATAVLVRRIAAVCSETTARAFISTAQMDPEWLPLARLDAATRLVESLVRCGATRRGGESARMIEALMRRDPSGQFAENIPGRFWTVSVSKDPDSVVLCGAVMIRVASTAPAADSPADRMSTEIETALGEPPVRPLRRVFGILSPATRRWLPLGAAGLAALGATGVAEGLLFRSFFDLVADVGLPQERLKTLCAFSVLVLVMLALEYRMAERLVTWGRELEARFSAALFTKLATLRSDYFGSRLISDLAERSHAVAELRALPIILGRGIRSIAALLITFSALLFLLPMARAALIVGTAALVGIALAFEPLFSEIELRARTHAGGMARFYLDSLVGLTTVRSHCAERSVRREHESLMTNWMRALQRQIAAAVSQTAALALVGFTLAAILIHRYLSVAEDPAGVLLVAYWTLGLPIIAADIAQAAQRWAGQRTILLRLIEPLDAPEEAASEPLPGTASTPCGVAVAFRGASFAASGHEILSGVDFAIPAGSYIGIVGPSGAGKSTLLGALLGWMLPHKGEVLIDDEPLTQARVAALRRVTAWVDPAVHLFNASMEENVCYVSGGRGVAHMPVVLSSAELYEVLQRISDSQMPLGDGGGLLSGGEGQRVRIARAMLQSPPRLVLLDEAFRGLDRGVRTELLHRCRRLWRDATILMVTHDVEETIDCDRVVVMDLGSVVEYDTPAVLSAQVDSRYSRMRESSRLIRADLWSNPRWRHLEMRDGRLTEQPEVL